MVVWTKFIIVVQFYKSQFFRPFLDFLKFIYAKNKYDNFAAWSIKVTKFTNFPEALGEGRVKLSPIMPCILRSAPSVTNFIRYFLYSGKKQLFRYREFSWNEFLFYEKIRCSRSPMRSSNFERKFRRSKYQKFGDVFTNQQDWASAWGRKFFTF